MRVIRLIAAGVVIATSTGCKKDRTPTEVSSVVQVIVEPITVAVEQGKTVTLRARVIGPGPVSQRVNWSSDNPEVATVTNVGLVSGITDGSARIRAAWAEDGEIYKDADVSVTLRLMEEVPSPLPVAPVVVERAKGRPRER